MLIKHCIIPYSEVSSKELQNTTACYKTIYFCEQFNFAEDPNMQNCKFYINSNSKVSYFCKIVSFTLTVPVSFPFLLN